MAPGSQPAAAPLSPVPLPCRLWIPWSQQFFRVHMFSLLARDVGRFLDRAETEAGPLDDEQLLSALSTFEDLFSRNLETTLTGSLFPTVEGGDYDSVGLAGVYAREKAGAPAIATEGESRVRGALINTLYSEAGPYFGVQPAAVTRLAATISRSPASGDLSGPGGERGAGPGAEATLAARITGPDISGQEPLRSPGRRRKNGAASPAGPGSFGSLPSIEEVGDLGVQRFNISFFHGGRSGPSGQTARVSGDYVADKDSGGANLTAGATQTQRKNRSGLPNAPPVVTVTKTTLTSTQVKAPYDTVGGRPLTPGSGGTTGLKVGRQRAEPRPTPLPQPLGPRSHSGELSVSGELDGIASPTEVGGSKRAGRAAENRLPRVRGTDELRDAANVNGSSHTENWSAAFSGSATSLRRRESPGSPTPRGQWELDSGDAWPVAGGENVQADQGELKPATVVFSIAGDSAVAACTLISAAWRAYAARKTFLSWREAARVIQGAALRRVTLGKFTRSREEWAREILGGAMEVQAEFRRALSRVFLARRQASAAYDSFMFMHTKATVPLRTGLLPFTLEPQERIWFQKGSGLGGSATSGANPPGGTLLPIILQSTPTAFSSGRSEMLHAASTPDLAFSSSTLRTLNYLCDPSVAHLIIVCQHKPKLNYYLQSLSKALGESVEALAKRVTIIVPEAFSLLGVSPGLQGPAAQAQSQPRPATYTGAIQTILLSSPKALSMIRALCQEQRHAHRNLVPYFLPTPGCYSSSENMRLSELVWRTGIPILGPLGPELGAYFGQASVQASGRSAGPPAASQQAPIDNLPGGLLGDQRAPPLPVSAGSALMTTFTEALAPYGPLCRYSLLEADQEFFEQQHRTGRILLAVPKVTQPLIIQSGGDSGDDTDSANPPHGPMWYYHDYSGAPSFGSVSHPGISGMDSYFVQLASAASKGQADLEPQRGMTTRSQRRTPTAADGGWDIESLDSTFRTSGRQWTTSLQTGAPRIPRFSALSWGSSTPVPVRLIPVLPISEFTRPSKRILLDMVRSFSARNYELVSLSTAAEDAELFSVVVSIDPQDGRQRAGASPSPRLGGSLRGRRAGQTPESDSSGGESGVGASVTVLGTFKHISERLPGTSFPGRTLGYVCPGGDPSRIKEEISPLLAQLVECGVLGLVTFSLLSIRTGTDTRFYVVETAFGTNPPYEHLMLALSHCGLSWNSVTGELIQYSRVASVTRDGRVARKEDLYSTANCVSPEAISSLGREGWTREPYFLVSLPFLWHEALKTTPSRDLLLTLMANAFGFDYDAREGFLFDWNSGSLSFGCMGVRQDLDRLLSDARRLCAVLLKRLDAKRAIVPDSLALESAWNGEAYATRRRECLRTNIAALGEALEATLQRRASK